MLTIAMSIAIGTLARWYMLRVDSRMYPSYPQGYLIHLTFGAIAAALGAVAVPAVIAKDYQAVTFLALAATQFREVRSLERETLQNMENTELVARGTAYIEGIARVFEARNYLALLASLITSLVAHLMPSRLIIAAIAGASVPLLLRRAMQGLRVSDIARFCEVPIEFDGPMLVAGGIGIMNVGLPDTRKKYLEKGVAIAVIPKDANAKATLSNIGQHQAMLHDVAGQLGVLKDTGEAEFTPIARRDPVSGQVVLVIIPAERNIKALMTAVGSVPVLESVRRRPLSSRAGRLAD
ncbi:MAG: YIEGIA family protein [Limnochordia bacterium]